nr:right-handed parallel beta-helix repeat-containing protein [bacterium]
MKNLKPVIGILAVIIACTVMMSAVHATTHVSGLISANTTWDLAGSPYWVDSDITVDTGVTLTIDPGVVVKMEYDHTLYSGGYQYTTRFIVNGILDAQGEPGNLIYFTSIRDDTVAGDTNGDGGATTPADGDWAYIQLNDSASVIDHCEIRYGGLRDDDPGSYETWHNYSVWCYQAAPAITNSMIRDSNISYGASPFITVLYDTVSENVIFNDNTIYNGGNGVYYVESAGIWPPLEPEFTGNLISGCPEIALYCDPISYNGLIQSNDIQDSGTAIYVNAAYPGTGYGAPPVINNDIESAIEGILIHNGGDSLVWDNAITGAGLGLSMVDSQCLVYDNTITGGSSYPLRQVETTFPVYSGNTITGNARQGVQIFGTIAGSGTWDMATGLPYVVTTDLVIAPGHTLTVLPGTVVKMDYNHMLYSGGYQFTTRIVAEGILDARGTEADPIWFTSIRDDSIAGDTNGDGGATTPADGDWGYIRLDDSAGVLDHCIVQYGGLRDDDPGTDELWHSYGIWCFESAPQITDCRISDMNISYGLEPYISVYYENITDPIIFRDNTILEGGIGLYCEEVIGLWPPLFTEVSGNTLLECDGWGMYLYGISSWADLRENVVDSCDGGMFLLDPTGVLGIPDVIGNTVLSSGNGIMIQNGGHAAVYQNTVSQCYAGIMLTDSDCMVEDNILIDNTGFPIWQMADSQPAYSGNTISGNFNSGIHVGGVISSDTHWVDVQNLGLPYAVMSNITVNPGASLTL